MTYGSTDWVVFCNLTFRTHSKGPTDLKRIQQCVTTTLLIHRRTLIWPSPVDLWTRTKEGVKWVIRKKETIKIKKVILFDIGTLYCRKDSGHSVTRMHTRTPVSRVVSKGKNEVIGKIADILSWDLMYRRQKFYISYKRRKD